MFMNLNLQINYTQSTTFSLACRCSEEAKKYQLQYFGIRNYGSCFGGNIDDIDGNMKSSECFQGISYGPCDNTNKEECGGKERTDYVYQLRTASTNGTLIFRKKP